MADTITQSSVVQITLVDAGGNKQSFNIDNPKDDITMSQIKTALAPAIASGFWYSKNSEAFTAVNSATVTESKKIKLDNSDVEIEITPASITFPAGTTFPADTTVSVTGATVIGAYVTDIDDSDAGSEVFNAYANYTANSVTLNVPSHSSSIAGMKANLAIVTDARTVKIPIYIQPNS